MSDNLPFLEKYSIEKKIKEGHFGSTYFAISNLNNEKVIIKHISLNKTESLSRITHIEQEAKIIANLKHPQIPKYVDFFTVEKEKTIEVYFVQEYIMGSNLNHLMNEKKFFSEEDVINIALGICSVLKYIHSFSPPIIHQDIKPANIILTYDNKSYLIDFGAVKQKILYERSSDIGISTIIGTHGYMPIEQFEGRAVPPSDIYSLGLTLIYLLSRKEPLQLDKKGLNFDLRKSIKVSDEMLRIIEKMTYPDWRLRYQSAYELEHDIALMEVLKNNKRKNKNKKIYEAIKMEIRDDERIRWFGKPDTLNIIKNKVLRTNLNSFLIYLLIILFIYSISSLFGISPLILLIISLSIVFFINYFDSKKLTYIITNLRIIIIRKGFYKTVKTFSNTDIIDIFTDKTKENQIGDLNFIRRNSSENFTFKSIENVKFVHKIASENIMDKDKNV